MSIGAISGYGAVNALSMRPYVYNTNTVSAASMNKLSRISDDVLDKKIDYSELADESLNENPLKKGQTLDFQGILDMQMRRGQNNAARIMRPAETAQAAENLNAATERFGEETAQRTTEVNTEAHAGRFNREETEADRAAKAGTTAEAAANENDGNIISYQMQQALQAYEMFMTA